MAGCLRRQRSRPDHTDRRRVSVRRDPDAKWLHYTREKKLRRVATAGGEEISISDKRLLKPVCSSDGKYVAIFPRQGIQIGIMKPRMDPTLEVELRRWQVVAGSPCLVAGQQDANFVTETGGNNSLWQQSLDEQQPRLMRTSVWGYS